MRWRRGNAAKAWIGGSLLVLFGIPPLYMALVTPSAPPVRLPIGLVQPANSQAEFSVYVANWGFHTSILIEQDPAWQLGPPGQTEMPWIEYAWGDRRFYQDGDTSVGTILAAVLWPTPSVMYVQGWSALPTSHNGVRQLWRRAISHQQLTTLITHLEQGFQRTATGDRVLPAPTSRFAGRFYPAREFYIFWNTCNTWTVRQLAQAELARMSFLVVLADQVEPTLEGFSRVDIRAAKPLTLANPQLN